MLGKLFGKSTSQKLQDEAAKIIISTAHAVGADPDSAMQYAKYTRQAIATQGAKIEGEPSYYALYGLHRFYQKLLQSLATEYAAGNLVFGKLEALKEIKQILEPLVTIAADRADPNNQEMIKIIDEDLGSHDLNELMSQFGSSWTNKCSIKYFKPSFDTFFKKIKPQFTIIFGDTDPHRLLSYREMDIGYLMGWCAGYTQLILEKNSSIEEFARLVVKLFPDEARKDMLRIIQKAHEKPNEVYGTAYDAGLKDAYSVSENSGYTPDGWSKLYRDSD